MSIIIQASEKPDDIFEAVRRRIEANRLRLLEQLEQPPPPAEAGPRPERFRAGGARGRYIRREPSGSQSICFRIAAAILQDTDDTLTVSNTSQSASAVLATPLPATPSNTDTMFDGDYPWPDLPGFENPGSTDFFSDTQGRIWLKAFRINPETEEILEDFNIAEHELLADEATIRDRTIQKYAGGGTAERTYGLPVRGRDMIVANIRRKEPVTGGTLTFSTGYIVDGNASTILDPSIVYIRYRPATPPGEDIVFLATGSSSTQISGAVVATGCALVTPAAVRLLATPAALAARLEYLVEQDSISPPWDAAPYFGVEPSDDGGVIYNTAGIFKYLRENVGSLASGEFGDLVAWLSTEDGWPPRAWFRHRAAGESSNGPITTETGLLFRSQAGRASYGG